MDSSDNHRSKSVAITVVSDHEPVECEGNYLGTDGGFVLEFYLGESRYIISHDNAKDRTRLDVFGLLSYSMDFTDGGNVTVAVAFGDAQLSMTPVSHSVTRDDKHVTVALEYKLKGGDTEALRTVEVSAKFKR